VISQRVTRKASHSLITDGVIPHLFFDSSTPIHTITSRVISQRVTRKASHSLIPDGV
jgi:hypothetical protein